LAAIPPLKPLLAPASQMTTHAAKQTSASKKTAAAFQKFEAMALQTFVEAMLPKSAETVYGKGTAGGIWKSMLAEQLAGEIARSGRLGLADHLARAAAASAAAMPAANATSQVSTPSDSPVVEVPLPIADRTDDRS